MKQAKILFFDIEASNLNADFGEILCISWKFLGEKKVHTVAVTDDPRFRKSRYDWNDKYVVEKFAEVYDSADIAVAHYGAKFDVPFINTRRLLFNLAPLSLVPFIDTWRTMKYKLKLHSNRLETAVQFFDLPRKTPLDGNIWRLASRGHPPSIKYVIEHCEADIRALEGAYLRLRPIINPHPNVALLNGFKYERCPKCGSANVVMNGTAVAQSTLWQRWNCKSCFAPYKTPIPKEENPNKKARKGIRKRYG